MDRQGSCHCGSVTFEVPELPSWVNSCNCSICTKLGTLMAYYPDDAVEVEGDTQVYIWGDRMIGLHHCPTCGCVTHWKTLGQDFGRMGINARLLAGFDPAEVEIRYVDNRDR
jgi:hypothetical protein